MAMCIGAGWALAHRFESPEQRQAAATPPAPLDVVVQVRAGVLEEQTTAVADVGDAATTSVRVTGASGLSVVTAAPLAPGASVVPGTVVLEVNGRPVFALPGAFPFYRDLSTGDTGPDVEQLQRALKGLGHLRGRTTGTFDAATEAAVRRMYKAAGYDPALVAVTPPAVETPAQGADGAPQDEASAADGAPQDEAPTGQEVPTAATPAATTVPLSDLTVVTDLPQSFVTGPGVGAVLTAESVYVLSNGALTSSSAVPAGIALQMKPGSAATLVDAEGTTVVGRVGPAVQDGADGAMRVSYLTEAALPASWRGTQVIATVTLETVGQESLIVPNRAVVTAGGGALTVLRRTSGNEFASVPVKRLGALAGQSAITPVEPGALKAGDEVRVR
ncbi:hypothetical protein Cch01nite_15630 [Cellulomonas chitinilytica]|uniref:Peptidoglycan binding-like domain-containing protein n=2 Tax=Cellulomonas chitinilytica TaxID=398759 RepID=A0A919P3P7_9CELL|nr:hypothetical protein Cch01nite_15630 [Cellulomonas chitinilytica]